MTRLDLLLDDAAIAIRTIRTVQVRASEMLKLYPNSEPLRKLARSLVVEGPACTCGEPVGGPSPWACPGCRRIVVWSVEARELQSIPPGPEYDSVWDHLASDARS